jgi:outer membrane protein
MNKTFFLSLIVIAALPQMARSQVRANPELTSLIRQSFSYFPRIREAENSVITAEKKLDLTQTNQPVVDGNLSYNFVEPKIVLPLDGKEFQFAPVHNVNANISASYLLADFGRLKANVERAKQDVQYAKHNVDYAKTQLAYQVAMIYYNIVFYQKAIAIQDTVLNFLNENLRIVESKLKNGDAIKIDVLNIQAQVDAEQNRKVDLINSLQKQINLLAYTTGASKDTGTTFDFDIPVKDTAAALSDAKAGNLEFALAKDRVNQALSDIKITKLTDRPSVSAGANTGIKNGYVPYVNDLRFNYAAGVALRVPIYSGGKTKKQIKLSETIVKQNELAAETLASNYQKDIQQALTDIRSNLERIENTKGQFEQALAAEQIAGSRFKNGVGTNLEITNAGTNVQRAALTRLQYEYQLCLAKLELARLTGVIYW